MGYHSGVEKFYAMFQIIFDEELKHIKFINSAGVVHYPMKLYPSQIWQILHTAAPVHWDTQCLGDQLTGREQCPLMISSAL